MRMLATLLSLCLGFAPVVLSQDSRDTSGRTITSITVIDSGPELRREAFDLVWQTVNDKHFDPKFGGVDWAKVRNQYSPRLASITNDRDFHRLLQDMLAELKQSHFNIIPPDALVDDGASEPKTGGIGIEVRVIDGAAVVVRVEPDGTAAKSGLKAGFVIKQIDQTPVAQILKRLSKSKLSPAISRLQMSRAVSARLNGEPGSQVRLVCLDERDRTRRVVLERIRLKGEMSPALGNFPPQYTEFESRILPGGAGYIRFNMFANSLMPKIREAIRSMREASGIIFDLRGNPGGFGGMSNGIAGYLETRQTSLGRMRFRTGYQNFAVFPQPNPYPGPVVILIDGLSASTSEVFSAGMQEIGRAVIVGETSVGAALPSIFQKLPTGARFQYAIADFRTPNGVLVEGRGVVPDVTVKLTRRLLLKGGDPQLEAAIEQIKKQRLKSPLQKAAA